MVAFLGIIGLALGSFVNALVWRLRMQEELRAQSLDLRKKKTAKQKTKDASIIWGRSMCVECKHQLGALDLVPVVSWLWLRGKCRYCKKPISWQYPAVELTLAALFILSYIWWPFELFTLVQLVLFAIWGVILTIMMALAVYDLRWMLLPNSLIYSLAAAALLFTGIQVADRGVEVVLSSLIGGLLLGGFFYCVYYISKGEWIGGGDVRYGFVMGFLLGWQKMLVGLMIAAYTGTLLVIILVLLKKYHKKMRVPFGPFLIFGTVAAMLLGREIIDWYLRLSGF